MKKRVLAVLALGLLTACESGMSTKQILGISRSAPDEFKVVSRPPLSMPPDFNLRPPQPGSPPRLVESAEKKARSLVMEPEVTSVEQSQSLLDSFQPQAATSLAPIISEPAPAVQDANFLKHLGVESRDKDIRSKLYSDETTPQPTTSKFALQELLGKGDDAEVIDPKAEAERLRENLDEDKPINEGEVKTIENKPNTLDLLFD